MILNTLADIVRNSGLPVVEVPGWQSRSAGTLFDVVAIICHHTAGAASGDYPSLNVVKNGRPDVPGPLAQLGLGRQGEVYVIAAGRANHAGKGSGQGMPTDQANSHSIGIEAESIGNGTDWTSEQRSAYPRLCAALAEAYGVSTARIIGHREWAPGRKPDPVGIDMDQLRREVNAIRGGSPAPHPEQRAQPIDGETQLLVDGKFGPVTAKRLQAFLASRGVYRGAIDGQWGPMSKAALRTWMYNAPTDKAAVSTLQLHLNNNSGASLLTDGQWGPRTTSALQIALNAGTL